MARDPEAPEAQGRAERAGAAALRWFLGARCGSVLTAMRGREKCRRRGRSGDRKGVRRRQWGRRLRGRRRGPSGRGKRAAAHRPGAEVTGREVSHVRG